MRHLQGEAQKQQQCGVAAQFAESEMELLQVAGLASPSNSASSATTDRSRRAATELMFRMTSPTPATSSKTRVSMISSGLMRRNSTSFAILFSTDF